MKEWTNPLTIEFIKLYEKEECLWNHKHPSRKDRFELSQAWERIRDEMSVECTVYDLKRKRDGLLATFRMQIHKIKNNAISGETCNKTVWFAYPYMERFLGHRYLQYIDTETCYESTEIDPKDDIKEEIESAKNREQSTNTANENNIGNSIQSRSTTIENNIEFQNENTNQFDDSDDDVAMTNDRSSEFEESVTPMRSIHNVMEEVDPLGKISPPAAPEEMGKEKPSELMAIILRKKQMNEAFGRLKSITQTAHVEKDECDLYGELLAKKLRKLDENLRDSVMYNIDNMLYKAKRKNNPKLFEKSTSMTDLRYE